MAKRYKATSTPASVERALGLLAAVVWCVTQGVSWLRLLVGGVALALAVWLLPAVLYPVRGAASTWGPTTHTLAPAHASTAAPAVPHE